MTCQHCKRPIHESNDPGVPYVHDDSGNAFCDVTSPADAVRLAGTDGRPQAWPRMTKERVAELRHELEMERISMGELIEIQGEFETIDPDTLPEPAENAMAGDMLNEIESRL